MSSNNIYAFNYVMLIADAILNKTHPRLDKYRRKYLRQKLQINDL